MNHPISVLCYGDSNTYGYNPSNGRRYPSDIRWTGRLQTLLGGEYHVIEEGCNGRTSVFKEPGQEWKNGLDYLKPCLNTHKPLDIMILMLGSNDLKTIFHASAKEIAGGVEELVKTVKAFTMEKQGFVPKIILVSPPHVGAEIIFTGFGASFDQSAAARSREFSTYYQAVAEKYGCIFLDAAKVTEPSKEDFLHLSPESHANLARALGNLILEKK